MKNDEQSVLNTSEIASLANTSRRNVEKVKNNIPINDDNVAKKLHDLLAFNKMLKELFLHPDFYELCEVAISKARKPSIRKFAVHCQSASESMRYKLNLTDIDRNEIKENNN